MSAALDRIEKQAAKQGARWRDTTRRSESMKTATAKAERTAGGHEEVVAQNRASRVPRQRVFRPDHHERRKPITLEEALLEMEDGRDYVAYRDAEKTSGFAC